MDFIFIFFGAGLGGVLRFLISKNMVAYFGKTFPYGTLLVNMSGCFLMGLFFVVIMDKFIEISDQLRAFLLIGFLGGYTTFSAFSIETLSLVESGAWVSAVLYVGLSIFFCLVAVWLGVAMGRYF